MGRRKRIIDQLRDAYPGRWIYAAGSWRHKQGEIVYRCAAMSPRYDGDDAVQSQLRRRSDGAIVGFEFIVPSLLQHVSA